MKKRKSLYEILFGLSVAVSAGAWGYNFFDFKFQPHPLFLALTTLAVVATGLILAFGSVSDENAESNDYDNLLYFLSHIHLSEVKADEFNVNFKEVGITVHAVSTFFKGTNFFDDPLVMSRVILQTLVMLKREDMEKIHNWDADEVAKLLKVAAEEAKLKELKLLEKIMA